jgi:uncharacterized protein
MSRTFKAIFATVILVLGGAAPVAAGPFDDAVAASAKGDYASAVRLLRPLADQGDAAAEFTLGSMYDLGQGLPEDPAEAVKLHRRAADQGFDPAQYAIAFRYISGRSVPQDYAVAYMWFDLAAKQGNQHAARERDKIAHRMTPAQIAEAQKLAREWKPKQ